MITSLSLQWRSSAQQGDAWRDSVRGVLQVKDRRKVPPLPPPQNLTSRTGTYNRGEALGWEGQTIDEVAEDPSGTEGPPEATPAEPCITASSVSRRVVLIGDSLPSKGSRGPHVQTQLRGSLLSPRGSGQGHY